MADVIMNMYNNDVKERKNYRQNPTFMKKILNKVLSIKKI